MLPLSDATLDAVLAVQLLLAWAGEGRCEPCRLGWWDTDVIDEAGGGDLFARLLPRTHAWASLEAAREAARRTDAKARSKMADPDKMRTLFFLGFDVDEQLDDRLAALKRDEPSPAQALSLLATLAAPFQKERLASVLREHASGEAAFDVVPGGRQLKGPRPSTPDVLVRRLASALMPFAEQYPLPFYPLGPGAETRGG